MKTPTALLALAALPLSLLMAAFKQQVKVVFFSFGSLEPGAPAAKTAAAVLNTMNHPAPRTSGSPGGAVSTSLPRFFSRNSQPL